MRHESQDPPALANGGAWAALPDARQAGELTTERCDRFRELRPARLHLTTCQCLRKSPMNHLQLQEAALPDLSESQISRLPKDQLVQSVGF